MDPGHPPVCSILEKKQVKKLLLLVAVMFSLVACEQKQSDSAPTPATAPSVDAPAPAEAPASDAAPKGVEQPGTQKQADEEKK